MGITWLRRLGVGTAIAAGVLYPLIGVGVLSIGEPTTGQTNDQLSFGLLMGGISAITAIVLWRAHSRVVLALVAAFQLLPLIGYVAVAGFREPPYDVWGVLIKVCQAVVLVVATALALRATTTKAAIGRPRTKGQSA